MKKLLSCITIALLTTISVSVAAPSKAEMMAKEKAAWQAFQNKDAAGFQKLLDREVVGVYSDGIHGMKGELASLKSSNMKSFKISDFKGYSDEKDVFVTSYKVKIVSSTDGKETSRAYNAGSVWKMEKGQWLVIFHTNAQKKE